MRLGFCGVNGLNRLRGEALVHARRERPYRSLPGLLARVTLNQDERRTPAAPGACDSFGGHRRDALWQGENPLLLDVDLLAQAEPAATTPSPLSPMDRAERFQADFDGQNLTTGSHAMALLRPHLPRDTWKVADLVHAKNGQRVRIAGNVICRQRPGTAKGFVFVSLEDETGIARHRGPNAVRATAADPVPRSVYAHRRLGAGGRGHRPHQGRAD